jgi:hypothetical protein
VSGKVSPLRLLNERDGEWRRLLSGVSLAAEIDIEPQDSRPVLAALGSQYGRLYEPDKEPTERDKARLLSQWPACLVVGMSGVAATDYEEGTYWRKLWDAVEVEVPQRNQRLWGEAYLGALNTLGLPAFSGSGHRFLGPILMHCGIPTYCLKDLLHMLADHSRRDPGLDANAFVLWATSGRNRMNSLDKPVRHLIEDGGEYAYDIIDRLLELLDRLRDPKPDFFGVGLPDRLVEAARSLANRNLIGLTPGSRHTAQRRAVNKPRLALDPFGEGPRILLPSTGNTWRVVVDGHTHDIRAARTWPGDDMTETSFPLARPARHVQVRPANGMEPVAITVVSDDDPLLIFSEDGESLPSGRPLPPDVVWALFPDDRKLEHEDEIHVVSEALLPFGWQGWTLREVDLSGAKQLGLTSGSARQVRGEGHPRLPLPEPLPGITAAHRQPVYGVAPLIFLPSDKPRTWHIELRQVDEQGMTKPVRLTARCGEVDPWGGLPRPIVGMFEVTILGPLGFRFHRRIAVAEGLSVLYEPDMRLLTSTGLNPAQATIAGQAMVSDTTLVFGEKQLDHTITYGPARFVVTPPHMSVLHDNATGGARWSAMPLRLPTESLIQNDPGWLLVRAPAAFRLPWLQVAGSGITQDVRPHGVQHPGQGRYPLAQITDTVTRLRRLDLGLSIRDQLVPVASVRPRVLATGAVLNGHQLKLTDCAEQPGLHVGIYAVYEPWREVTVLPVRQNGIVTLPSRLTTAGPLRVLPAMQDASSSWPYWPPSDDSFLVEAPAGGHREQTGQPTLSAFLAGQGPCPENLADERIWLVVTLADQLQADGAREDLRGQCEMSLRSYPVPALLALTRTRLSPAEAVAELIRTGLAEQALAVLVQTDDIRYLWGRLPVVAALLSGGILADPERMPELIELVAADYGAALADMLHGEGDPYQDDPRDSGSHALPESAQAVSNAIELLNATPYSALASRVLTRPDGAARLSAALALAIRADAATSSRRRNFRRKYRQIWTDLARAEPDLVTLDIIAAQAAISAIERRSRTGERRDRHS